MVSVRTLAAHKLKLYFDALKLSALQSSSAPLSSMAQVFSRMAREYSLASIYKLDVSGKRHLIAGRETSIAGVDFVPKAFWLRVLSPNELMLITRAKEREFIWVFDRLGIDLPLSQRAGLGNSGEIYVVGKDGFIKSASRHVSDWAGTRVSNDSVSRALKGESGVHNVLDYRGKDVVSAFAPFEYDDLEFIILSEMDHDEVLSPLRRLFPRIFLICGFISFGIVLLAYASTFSILGLIARLREEVSSHNLRLITAMEEERKRLSYSLHDGVGQILTAIKWGISGEPQSRRLKDLCDEAFQEVRNVSFDLMPAVLTELGLFAAVRDYLLRTERIYGIETTFRFSSQLARQKFRQGMDVNLYRIVQELILNTVKHAEAKSITVVFLDESNSIHLRYEDDGIGLDPHAPMPGVLQYRCEILGAEVIRTTASPGLVYDIRIPLERLYE